MSHLLQCSADGCCWAISSTCGRLRPSSFSAGESNASTSLLGEMASMAANCNALLRTSTSSLYCHNIFSTWRLASVSFLTFSVASVRDLQISSTLSSSSSRVDWMVWCSSSVFFIVDSTIWTTHQHLRKPKSLISFPAVTMPPMLAVVVLGCHVFLYYF